MKNQTVSLRYVFAGILAVIVTWFIHEFTHWVTSELLGYESYMRLNSVGSLNGNLSDEVDKAIISISGPIITILQGIIIFIVLKSKGWNKYLYLFLFIAFYMRFFAGLMNFINPNDEARFSQFLGIGTHTVSIIVSIFLFAMVYIISKKYKLNWKFQLWTTIIVLVASWTLILVDQYFKIRII
jgi:hypothetical protein